MADLSSLSDEELRALVLRAREAKQQASMLAKLTDYRPYPKQEHFHALGATYRQRLFSAGNQLGKALHVDEPVLTPSGWVRIGDLREGDTVIAGDGSHTVVTGVFPQGIRPLIRVTFDYGTSILCDKDHLWKVKRPADRWAKRGWSVERTEDMMRYGNNPTPKQRFVVPHVGPVRMDAKPGAVDPYLLGVLLGDGCLRQVISFSSKDPEIAGAFIAHGYTIAKRGAYDWSVINAPVLKRELVRLGVWGKLAHEKFVPSEYKHADPGTRLAILQGLMDTDGTCEKSGHTSFTSVSKELADDVVFLARSLGGKCYIRSRVTSFNGKQGRVSFTVAVRLPHAPVFRLARKLARYVRPASTTDNHVIVRYKEVPPGEAVCISVAHPDRTYVTRDFVVTHNTYSGAAELAYHLTGRYPAWWRGRRWDRPTSWLAGSESGELTRDGMQRLLVGPPAIEEMWGTGLIPRDALAAKPKRRAGIKDAIDAVVVNHVQGGQSVVQFKSFDQGRAKWQASTVDGVWLDEEPPYDVYEEAITRTNATDGMVYITFTPLKGMSQVVMKFFQRPGNDCIVVQMTIDDVGHYSEEQKAKIIATYDDATRDARTKGIPVLGSGRVFNLSEDRIKIDPIRIPDHWARVGGLDFGWDHPFGAVELVWDRDTDTIYLVREYRESKQTPLVHAATLKQWGGWLPWMWPHDGNQHDKGSGLQLAKQYRNAGLATHTSHVTFEDGSVGVEAGIMEMLTRMNEGRWKVFSTCTMWLNEFSLYHRKDGLIVKLNDDLISASRYAMMGRRFAKAPSRRASWGGERRSVPVADGTGEVRL